MDAFVDNTGLQALCACKMGWRRLVQQWGQHLSAQLSTAFCWQDGRAMTPTVPPGPLQHRRCSQVSDSSWGSDCSQRLGKYCLLIPRPLHITLFSMVLCHSLACTETGPAKPSLSKTQLFTPRLECQHVNQDSSAQPRDRGSGCSPLGAGRRHRMMLMRHRGAQGWADTVLGTRERQELVWEGRRAGAGDGEGSVNQTELTGAGGITGSQGSCSQTHRGQSSPPELRGNE